MNAANAANELVATFEQHGVGLDADDVATDIRNLCSGYDIPMNEAQRMLKRTYAEQAGLELDDIHNSTSIDEFDPVALETIDSSEEWIDVQVEVVELWEPNSEKIRQVGLVADDTRTLKFVSWETSDLQLLEDGVTYDLRNVVTDEYEGRYSIKLNGNTEISESDASLDVEATEDLVLPIVDVQSGSGLIKRCPEADCTRVLRNGRCAEHGEGDGAFDLRIKAVMDDGQEARNVIFDEEVTEEVAGISLDEATEMAMDALDTSVVTDVIEDEVLGRYYEVELSRVGNNYLVEAAAQAGSPDEEATQETLSRARSFEFTSDGAADAPAPDGAESAETPA